MFFWIVSADFSGLNNFDSLDFSKYPALRFARFTKAEMKSADCLYSPSKWLQFETTSPGYYEVDLSWTRSVKIASDSVCGPLPDKPVSLGLLKLQQDPELSLHRMITLTPVQTLLDGIPNGRNLTFEQFEAFLRREKRILKNLVEWNDEYAEITGELFLLLDVNRDAVFSVDDFDVVTRKDEELFLGRLQDRIADFTDLMNDQQAEKGPGALGGGSGSPRASTSGGGVNAQTKAYMDQTQEEIKKLVAEAMEKIKELNQTQTDSPKTGEPPRESKEPPRTRKEPSRESKEPPRTRKEPRREPLDREGDAVRSALNSGGAGTILDDQNAPEEIMAEEVDGEDGTVPAETAPVKMAGKDELWAHQCRRSGAFEEEPFFSILKKKSRKNFNLSSLPVPLTDIHQLKQ